MCYPYARPQSASLVTIPIKLNSEVSVDKKGDEQFYFDNIFNAENALLSLTVFPSLSHFWDLFSLYCFTVKHYWHYTLLYIIAGSDELTTVRKISHNLITFFKEKLQMFFTTLCFL